MTEQNFDDHDFAAALAVERELSELFQAEKLRAADFDPQYRTLWYSLEQASQGGKRMRSSLVHGVHHALGGSDDAGAARVGAALELLHTAFLCHDDVIDKDDHRRGRPTIARQFRDSAEATGAAAERARHWGDSSAILAGDLALHASQRMLAVYDFAPATRRAILNLFDRAVFVSVAGELSDIGAGGVTGPIGLPQALGIADQKTAVYSFEVPLCAGAVLAGADAELITTLGGIGRNLGIAFQLVDDLLGVFGDEQVTGKSALGDLREGKDTVLIVKARQSPVWSEIRDLVGNPELTEDQASAVREALERSGARASVESLIAEHLDAALSAAAQSGLPQPLHEYIVSVAFLAVQRAA